MLESNPKHKPENYVEHTLSTLVLVHKIKTLCPKASSIFDLGCSSGRVLNELLKNQYINLYGCDINDTKVVMNENFPLLSSYFTFVDI